MSVLGPLTGNPAGADVAKDLASAQLLAPTVKKDGTGAEEVGTGRRKLVEKIEALRDKVALLSHAGLPPDVLARIKPLIYRAIDDVSPYCF